MPDCQAIGIGVVGVAIGVFVAVGRMGVAVRVGTKGITNLVAVGERVAVAVSTCMVTVAVAVSEWVGVADGRFGGTVARLATASGDGVGCETAVHATKIKIEAKQMAKIVMSCRIIPFAKQKERLPLLYRRETVYDNSSQ